MNTFWWHHYKQHSVYYSSELELDPPRSWVSENENGLRFDNLGKKSSQANHKLETTRETLVFSCEPVDSRYFEFRLVDSKYPQLNGQVDVRHWQGSRDNFTFIPANGTHLKMGDRIERFKSVPVSRGFIYECLCVTVQRFSISESHFFLTDSILFSGDKKRSINRFNRTGSMVLVSVHLFHWFYYFHVTLAIQYQLWLPVQPNMQASRLQRNLS